MVRIITDTSADLTTEQAAELGVTLAHLGILFEDGIARVDREDLTPEEYYEKLIECKKLPTTSQPAFAEWVDIFEDVQKSGDEAVVLTISGELSGTVQGAIAAKDVVGCEDIHIVDSKAAALSLNLLVRLAVRMRDAGGTAEEIAATIEKEKKRVRLVALIDDLKYLHKGGRLPGAVAITGNALGIKPVISVIDGKVKLTGKGRGLPGAYVAVFKQIEKEGGIDPASDYILGYTHTPKRMEPIETYLRNNLKLPLTYTCHVGPAIGTHVGPACGGIAFFAKNYEETTEEQP